MAWGGGIYTEQNKILPGAYFKFETEPGEKNIFTDRGTVALIDTAPWGKTGEVVAIDRDDFLKDPVSVTGYEYAHMNSKKWRELFYGAEKVLFYRVGDGAAKAKNKHATAKHEGERGNAISITITPIGENWAVKTFLDSKEVDAQTVATAKGLTSNAWVDFNQDEPLAETVEALALEGGADGTADVTEWRKALNAFEGYRFDILCAPTDDKQILEVVMQWSDRMVREVGLYHQLVLHGVESANNPYVISVYNSVKDASAPSYALVYYVAGIESACAVNKDLTGHDYVGDYIIDVDGLTQKELINLKNAGRFVFHRADDVITVLDDINTYTDFEDDAEENFRYNQVIRVLNQRANDSQKLFIKHYLGKAGTDENARMLFKNDLAQTMINGLLKIGAVSEYRPDDTKVEAGKQPRSFHVVERIKPNMAVTHLYHDIIITREGA